MLATLTLSERRAAFGLAVALAILGLVMAAAARQGVMAVHGGIALGLGLILVGSLVGGLFAAFAFALSLFSVPMLMSEKRDALTAMGLSFAMTTHNIRPCLAWGVIVAVGMVLSAATGLLALAVVFPVLGHGTWHAWRAIGEPTR